VVFNILTPSHEVVYKVFSGQYIFPTFETIVAFLIKKETHINTTMWAQCFNKRRCLGDENVNFFPYRKAPFNYGRGRGLVVVMGAIIIDH
jgi:hypothetical protein